MTSEIPEITLSNIHLQGDIPKFQCTEFFFTYHIQDNDTFDEQFLLLEQLQTICKKYVWGEEYGKSGKTPHIQGGFILEERKRAEWLAKRFFKNGVSLYKMKSWGATKEYCVKEQNRVVASFKIPKPLVKVERHMLRENQKSIADLFEKDEHAIFGRTIYWFWEEDGNWGKSFLCTHMIDFMGAMEVSGASADILCGVQQWIEKNGEAPRIIIFDIPRVNKGHVSYQAIEKIKDGKFFSGKYESGMCRFNKPHIICFSNERPETDKLSYDRWKIADLSGCEGANWDFNL